MPKVVAALVVVFIGFWMYQDPSGLADVAGAAGGKIGVLAETSFNAIIDFIDALMS